MKGYIKIEAGTHEGQEGLFVKSRVKDASTSDKYIFMHSLKKALQITDEEWMLYVIGEHEGLFDDMSEVVDLADE